MHLKLSSWFLERPIRAFFVLTFGFAWVIWIPVGLVAPENLPLLALPGAWSPTLAAVVLTATGEGRAGLRALWQRVFRLRQAVGWYFAAVFGVALVAGLALSLHRLFGGDLPQLTLPAEIPAAAWPVAVPLLFVSNVLIGGPIAEEAGWRGYALPLMRRSMSSLRASLLIGAAWGVWHLPFFVIPGASGIVGGIGFPWFVLLTMSWSVLFGWIYVNTGSIFMAVLCHAAFNTTFGTLGLLGSEVGWTLTALNVALAWMAVALVVLRYGPDLTRVRGRRKPHAQPPHPASSRGGIKRFGSL